MQPYPDPQSRQSLNLRRALELLLEQTAHRVRQGVRAAATLDMQESHVKFLLEELGADRPLTEITYQLVIELGERLGRRLSPRTVAKRLSTLRRALRLAVACGELAAMPMFPEVALPPWKPRERILRTFAEYKRLCAALAQRRADWVAVAVWTIQRPGDVERMCWSDVQLSDDRLQCGPSMLIRSTKTRKPSPMRVKMPAPLVQVLQARLGRLSAAGAPPQGSDRLVDPWPGVSRTLPVVCARIGLPPMSAMDLRHSGISWMVRRTGLTVAAQRWAGWSSFTMMERYYAHALPAQLGQAADELSSIVLEGDNDNGREDPPPAAPARARAGNDNDQGG